MSRPSTSLGDRGRGNSGCTDVGYGDTSLGDGVVAPRRVTVTTGDRIRSADASYPDWSQLVTQKRHATIRGTGPSEVQSPIPAQVISAGQWKIQGGQIGSVFSLNDLILNNTSNTSANKEQ